MTRRPAQSRSDHPDDELDRLTQLRTRRRMDQDLAALGAGHVSKGFAMVELDDFDRFVAEHGQPAGDLVLQEVATTIIASVRLDDIVYRPGDAGFSVLLHDVQADEAVMVMERVRAAVAEAELPGGRSVTISVGLAVSSAEPDADLAEAADDALDSAKQAGRNRVVLAGS